MFMFATINELYTMSSAWTLRKTLLTAAKTFLLRPGNPQLESIRQLLQTTVLDANTSDAGIALHLRKLRENSLPTEEELAAWPAELSPDAKEELRRKARKLLVERCRLLSEEALENIVDPGVLERRVYPYTNKLLRPRYDIYDITDNPDFNSLIQDILIPYSQELCDSY